MSTPRWLRAVFLVGAVCATASAHAQQVPDAPTRYVTVAGDTCVRIARRFYRDSRATVFIHAANPTMGPPPHHLHPGMVLTIPPRAAGSSAPDALLTAVHNQVEVAAPAPRRGQPNDPLFRGTRVNTQERSAAEVTFADETQLRLEERTLVVILGETSSRVQRSASARDTVLERGALTAFLAGLDQQRRPTALSPPPAVSTAAGRVSIERSADGTQARLEVDDHARTTVSVYRGRTQVRQRRQRVAVPQGYGVRAEQGHRIPPPRALPLAPTWALRPNALILTDQATAALIGEYRAGEGTAPVIDGRPGVVPPPAQWRVEVARDASFNEPVANSIGDAARTRLDVPDVEPGTYHVRVSAIDAERFQGPPGEPVSTVVARVATAPVRGPGRRATVTVTPTLYCGLDGATLAEVSPPVEIDRLSEHVLRCALDASGASVVAYRFAPERLGPLLAELQLQDIDARARTATARVTVRDGQSAPVTQAGLRVEAISEGVSLGATSSAEPGVYLAPLSWATGGRAVALRVLVNEERAETQAITLPSPPTEAPAAERWYHRLALRVEGGAGYMLSEYQRNTNPADAHYGPNALALSWGGRVSGMVGVSLLRPPGGRGGPALALELGGAYWNFPGGATTTLREGFAGFTQVGGGLRFEPFPWRARVYIDGHAGATFSGAEVLPSFDVGLGVDVPLGGFVAVGPYLRYAQIIDTRSGDTHEDPIMLSGGIAFTLHPASPLAR